ncbi:MAG TPA: AbfB domain-containing protein [Asanoa sp.]|nr:AbfB domain-containing protein [Asanoa sp.]
MAPTTLPTNQRRSLQVTTPGYTNRYLRRQNSLANTEVVTASSPALLKNDATYTISPGLADASCYSFEFGGLALQRRGRRGLQQPDVVGGRQHLDHRGTLGALTGG